MTTSHITHSADRDSDSFADLKALVDSIWEWANDRALPPHSEFVQGVRSAQEHVRFLIAKHRGTP